MISALLRPSIIINGKKYKIMKQIGEGGFAFVYDVMGTGKESGEHYALKKMICQTDEQLDEAKKEIETMLKLKSPHVLELVDYAYSLNKKSQKEALLLLPLYQCSVQTVIEKGPQYPHCGFADGLDVLKILRHVIEGLKAIHAAGLRHADLKPGNILLTASYDAVITDFGSVSPTPQEINSRAEALTAQDKASSCTTASYRAPELFNTPSSCVLGSESDVWSLGCLIYCMFYSRSPFESAAEGLSTLSVISAHYQIPESNLWPVEYLDVIAGCLKADPAQRASLTSIQAQLQSIPCPPLDTRPTTPLLPPVAQSTHPQQNHHQDQDSSAATTAAALLEASTSTTSSAVSTSHLEFSETSSCAGTPTVPGMSVSFADFSDAALNVSIPPAEPYVLARLKDPRSASQDAFAGGSVHSEMLFDDHVSGSGGSIADSYVHAENETISNLSSGNNTPLYREAAIIDNLPVRKGMSSASFGQSHESFDFMEGGSASSSSPRSRNNLTTHSDDTVVLPDANTLFNPAAVSFASFAAFPATATAAAESVASAAPTAGTGSTPEMVGIAEWEDEFDSSDEEFGEFTTSAPAATLPTSEEICLPGKGSPHTAPLVEVDLWKVITEQALPSVAQGMHVRRVVKEGPVYMMRQGGFPKRWAKKQVWLVLTPLGLILRKDSSAEARIHEVLSLHRPTHLTPSDTLAIGLNGLQVMGSAPVPLAAALGSGSGKRTRSTDMGDWVKVKIDVDADGVRDVTTSITSTDTPAADHTASSTTATATSAAKEGKGLFMQAKFEISFDSKDDMNAWMDAIDELRAIFM